MKAKRRIVSAHITYISLVDKGANKKSIIWKGVDDDSPAYEKVIMIVKIDTELRLVYGIVYSPDEVDTHGDTADATTIRAMAHDFMKGRFTTNVDRQHDFVADEGFVAESWILQKSDPVFPKEPAGSWAVAIKVENDDTWAAVKKGDIGGISMAGMAQVEEIEPVKKDNDESLVQKILDGVRGLFVEKDFNAEIKRKEFDDARWAFNRAVDKITMDPKMNGADKKKQIVASIDQFKKYIQGVAFSKGDEDMIKKNGNEIMNDELQTAIADAVEKAMQPLTERLDKIEKSDALTEAVTKAMKDGVDPLAERIDKLEKAAPGSRQERGGDNEIEKAKGLSLV